MKRLFDLLFSTAVLLAVSPILLFAAIGIKLSSRGSVFYLAERGGKDGEPFKMYKFRTMRAVPGGAVITATNDPRVFALGKFLRKSKIDELPQFINVLKGEMSVVGPRPEDPKIIAEHYSPWMMETLSVLPGITSPGAVFYYAHGEDLVDDDDPEGSYVAKLLSPKLAVELGYIKAASFIGDMRVIYDTARFIVLKVLGRPCACPARYIAAASDHVDLAQLKTLQ